MRRLEEDIIRFNKNNADLELPPGKTDESMTSMMATDCPIGYENQSKMETYASSDMSQEVYDELFANMRKIQLENVLSMLNANDVDVIIAPAGGRLASVAAAAGCPVANYPLGFAHFRGRAHGVNVIARPNDEVALVRVMSQWEKLFPEARRPPPSLD